MKKFTDLLDNYLLALGVHNQLHHLNEVEPLRWAADYREATEALRVSKDELNTFMDSLKESLSGLVTP